MKISRLLTGKSTGLIKLKSDNVDGKVDFYNLDFEFIKVDPSKLEVVDKVVLHNFKIKPYAELKKQSVEFTYEKIKYNIELEHAIINNLVILEKITTTNNEKYVKFSGDIFSEISYLKIEEKLEEKLTDDKEIDHTIKSTKEKVITPNSNKSGCFSPLYNSANNSSQSRGGCFQNRNYNDLKSFYRVNSNYLKEKQQEQKTKNKEYWSKQSQNRKEYFNSDFSPFRNLGSSFLNLLSLIISILALLLISIKIFEKPFSLGFFWEYLVLLGFICIILFGWFISPFKSTFKGRILRWISLILATVLIFTSNIFDLNNSDDYEYDRDREDDTEIIEETPLEEDIVDDSEENQQDNKPKTEKVIKRSLKWNDFSFNSFEEDFKTSISDYNDGKKYLNNLNVQYSGRDFWTRLYLNIYRHESKKNKYILQMYKNLKPIQENKILSRREKLEAIITSVQEIPYYLVHENSCRIDASKSSFSRDYHRKNQPCISSKRFGIALPSEFSATFKGDCDTRSMYLYMVLKKLGYDVAILVSEPYAHAILGINIPGQGKYIRHRGKKYLTLETTSDGWKIGQLPPNVGDTRKWRVALN